MTMGHRVPKRRQSRRHDREWRWATRRSIRRSRSTRADESLSGVPAYPEAFRRYLKAPHPLRTACSRNPRPRSRRRRIPLVTAHTGSNRITARNAAGVAIALRTALPQAQAPTDWRPLPELRRLGSRCGHGRARVRTSTPGAARTGSADQAAMQLRSMAAKRTSENSVDGPARERRGRMPRIDPEAARRLRCRFKRVLSL
jgi:hypothetical protein